MPYGNLNICKSRTVFVTKYLFLLFLKKKNHKHLIISDKLARDVNEKMLEQRNKETARTTNDEYGFENDADISDKGPGTDVQSSLDMSPPTDLPIVANISISATTSPVNTSLVDCSSLSNDILEKPSSDSTSFQDKSLANSFSVPFLTNISTNLETLSEKISSVADTSSVVFKSSDLQILESETSVTKISSVADISVPNTIDAETSSENAFLVDRPSDVRTRPDAQVSLEDTSEVKSTTEVTLTSEVTPTTEVTPPSEVKSPTKVKSTTEVTPTSEITPTSDLYHDLPAENKNVETKVNIKEETPVKTSISDYQEFIEPDLKLSSIKQPFSLPDRPDSKQHCFKSSEEVYQDDVVDERFGPEDVIALVFLDVQVLSLENTSEYSQIGVYVHVTGISDPERMTSKSFLFPLQPPEVGELSVKVYLKLLEKLRVRISRSDSAQFIKDSDRSVKFPKVSTCLLKQKFYKSSKKMFRNVFVLKESSHLLSVLI